MKREEEAWVFTALHSGFVLLALTMATHLWSHVLLAVFPLRAHTQGRTCSKIIYYRTQRLLLKLRLQLHNRRRLHEEEPRAPRENRTEKGAPKGLTHPSRAQPFLALWEMSEHCVHRGLSGQWPTLTGFSLVGLLRGCEAALSPPAQISAERPCSRAAVTNYHKLGGSTQLTCNLSQSWRPEVWNQDVSRQCAPSGGSREESSPAPSSFWPFVASSLQSASGLGVASSSMCLGALSAWLL